MTSSKTATAAVVIAAGALSLPAIGVLGIQIGIFAPMTGFTAFAAGCGLGGLLSLVLGTAGLVVTRGGADPEGRKRAVIALGGGVALVGLLLLSAGPSRDLPPINDITTDLADPPAFRADPAERGRDMAYPGEFVAQVEAAYSDLRPLRTTEPLATAFARAVATAEEIGWTITHSDEARGLFEARQETQIFHFVDDVAVRVRQDGAESVVDLRSKSRDGRGDLGANAARIRAFASAYGN